MHLVAPANGLRHPPAHSANVVGGAVLVDVAGGVPGGPTGFRPNARNPHSYSLSGASLPWDRLGPPSGCLGAPFGFSSVPLEQIRNPLWSLVERSWGGLRGLAGRSWESAGFSYVLLDAGTAREANGHAGNYQCSEGFRRESAPDLPDFPETAWRAVDGFMSSRAGSQDDVGSLEIHRQWSTRLLFPASGCPPPSPS